MKTKCALLTALCVVGVVGTGEADLLWDFDTGNGVTPSLDGWTIMSNGDPAIDRQPLIQVEGSERNRLANEPVLTTSWDRDGEAGGFIGDGSHPHLIARSPTFLITEAGDITWQEPHTNSGAAPVLTAGTYNDGAMGMALVRASDGVMIASVATTTATKVFDVDGALDLLNDGVGYYLEAVDTYIGGWGYIEWDNVSVPGELVSGPSAAPFKLTITPNATTPGSYDFEWVGKEGKLYDLVSATSLATAPGTWDVYDPDGPGGEPAYQDISPGGTTTTLMDVPGGSNPTRFFVLVEKDPPSPDEGY